MTEQIKVAEIFNSISGEVNPYGQGVLTTFLRFSGCSQTCHYCDTPISDSPMLFESTESVFFAVVPLLQKTGVLCITGGEPLESNIDWRTFFSLLNELAAKNNIFKGLYIETNGCEDISTITNLFSTNLLYFAHSFVLDWKAKNENWKPENMQYLRELDFVKYLVYDLETFFTAIDLIEVSKFLYGVSGFHTAISLVNGSDSNLSEKFIIETLLERNLHWVVLNTQIHKFCNLK